MYSKTCSRFKPLRTNLGKKNCELAPDDIERISRSFLDFKETPESKIVPNAAFGHEISFMRHFYKLQPLRTLAEISADILAIEKGAEGLLDGLLVEATQP